MKPFNSAYVAGPMTGIPEFNSPMFDEVSAWLRDKLAIKVISPAEIDRADGFDEKGPTGFEPLSDEMRQRFARNDIQALLEVDAIVLLPGWENSTGATNEAKVASWLGLHAFEVVEMDADGKVFRTLRRLDLEHKWSSVIEEPAEDPDFAAFNAMLDAPPVRNARAQVLLGAEELVNGDRNNQYGDPLQDFQRTAQFWNAYLDDGGVPRRIGAEDVAAMMALLKLSRIAWSPAKLDSWTDLAGYAACGWHCVDATYEEVIK